jgi:hypothetical protein
VDLDYNDSIHLSIATNIVVNFPQPRFAVLPVNLGVEVLGFGGTVSIHLCLEISKFEIQVMAVSRKKKGLIWVGRGVVIAYDAATACVVDATARGEQTAFTLVAPSRFPLERQGDQSTGE